MPEFTFNAILKEKSEITIWIDATTEKEALKKIKERDFSWSDQVKHSEYIKSEIQRIRLTT